MPVSSLDATDYHTAVNDSNYGTNFGILLVPVSCSTPVFGLPHTYSPNVESFVAGEWCNAFPSRTKRAAVQHQAQSAEQQGTHARKSLCGPVLCDTTVSSSRR